MVHIIFFFFCPPNYSSSNLEFLLQSNLHWGGSTTLKSVYSLVFHYLSLNMAKSIDLKGNITFVRGHTANAAWFFPLSSSWHQMLCKNVNVALVDYLYQGFYALNTLYGTCVTLEFWFTNEISKRRWEKCITNRAEWMSSSVLHCYSMVAAWRCENTRDVGSAS